MVFRKPIDVVGVFELYRSVSELLFVLQLVSVLFRVCVSEAIVPKDCTEGLFILFPKDCFRTIAYIVVVVTSVGFVL